MVDILAALVAHGVSEVEGVEEIDRGYERIDERLRQLGADITRV
jgi:UDP-N-acetylglucosamine 1-carboxyvinyltransferase